MGQFKYFDPIKEPIFAGLEYRLQILLDQARAAAGIPFTLTSGRRSPEANAEAHGVDTSLHLVGLAADLHVTDAGQLALMVNGLRAAGARNFVIGVKVKDGKIAYHNLHVELDDAHPDPHLSVKLYT